jgi:hypothetical protein
MEKIGEHYGRLIYYIKINDTSSWENELPDDEWLAVPIGHEKDIDLIKNVSKIFLRRNVNYLCSLGKASEFIHDVFDEEMIKNRIEKGLSIENPEDFKYEPMTTWHEDFGEGVWFALINAYVKHKEINKIVCLDLTEEGEKNNLLRVIDKIKNGWLPED